MKSFVSVIIPAYNCEKYIAEAVESGLAQDYPSVEIIVVNDGSTDGTMDVLRTFGDKVRIVDQTNGGPPKARNAGLLAAKGDYIAFLDADDVWLPQKISAQVAHLDANPDVGTCYCSWHVWPADKDGVFRKPTFYSQPFSDFSSISSKSGWIYDRLLFDCELLTTTVMVRSSIVKKVGEFDIKLWNGDDYDYWIRLSQVAKISCLAPTGALYRVVEGSVSRRAKPINHELLVIKRAIGRFGLTDPAGTQIDADKISHRLDSLIFKFGYLHLRSGDPAVALSAFLENLQLRPLQPKIWLHVVEAFFRRLLRGNALTGA